VSRAGTLLAGLHYRFILGQEHRAARFKGSLATLPRLDQKPLQQLPFVVSELTAGTTTPPDHVQLTLLDELLKQTGSLGFAQATPVAPSSR